MKKILFIFILSINTCLYSQINKKIEYAFFDKYPEADLNYNAIDSIDHYTKGLPMLDSVFNIIEGQYTVYRFLNHDKGVLFDDSGIRDIYNIVILKIDKKNRIIDAYRYSLTNPQMPSKCTLYKASKNRKLTSNFKIKKLRFKRERILFKDEDVCHGIPVFLQESGRLIW